MILRTAILAALLPNTTVASSLDCVFTTLCNPQAGCQDSAGVPFSFEVLSGTLSFSTPQGVVFGTPLSHLSPPAIGALFVSSPDSTVLLTVSGSGAAVMVQTDVLSGDRVQSVSYFGTCEPGT